MKKIFLFLLIAYNACGQSPWMQLPNFPGSPRSSACMFIINDVVYAGTGRVSTVPFVVKKDFYKYDPFSNSWTQVADLPGERWISSAFSIGNKGYVALGAEDMGGLSDLWEYDPASNSWTQKASLPAANRWGAFSFVINGKGYVGGGLNSTDYNDLWEYDPLLDRWTQKASFPLAMHAAVAFAINNKGYMGLGRGTNFYDNFYEYDPVTNTWAAKASFPDTARYIGTGFSLGNKGYAGMGMKVTNTGLHVQKDFWQYDPGSDTWAKIPSIPGDPRSHCVAASTNQKAYIMGGFDSYYKNDFYTISATSFTGINSKEIQKNYSIYSFSKSIIINNQENLPLEVLFTDIVGKKIYSGKIPTGKKEIDLKNISSGLIIYQIIGANKNVSSGKLFISE